MNDIVGIVLLVFTILVGVAVYFGTAGNWLLAAAATLTLWFILGLTTVVMIDLMETLKKLQRTLESKKV